MMKAKSQRIFSLLAGVLLFIASLAITPASTLYFYQPKVPKCLK